MSNTVSFGKAHIDIYKDKAEKATPRTEEEKEIAHQLRKGKEAKANMELHQAKVEHAAKKMRAKQCHLYGHHHHHHTYDSTKLSGMEYVQNETVVGCQEQVPVEQWAAMSRATLPAYPLGGTALGMEHITSTFRSKS